MTTAQSDTTTLAVVVLGGLLVLLLALAARRTLPEGPQLPPEDRAPAGLGRLVPVGAQVDEECRRGLVALEAWLAARRRSP